MIIPKGTVVTIDGKVYRTLEAQVAWNKEELESLDIEALEALPDQFTELQENVSALGDSVADVVEDVGGLESDMTDAQSDISGLKTRMTTAETNIGTNAGEISQLQFDVGQAQGDITALGNSKLNKPTNTGEVGDVIVKTAGGTEYQSVAPFNPNATYPNVTAGKAISAKSLENVSEDSGASQDEPFFFQAAATANNTTETPTAPVFELKSIRGNTIVYNQLVDGVTQTYPTISGHVYWFKHDPLITLVTSTGTDINVPTPQSDKLVDLTRWFNGNIPQAILDDPTVFPVNYYDGELTYSAGELKNCSCTELTTVGFNLFDKDSVVVGYAVSNSTGNLSTASGKNASDWIRIPMGMKLYQNVSFVGNYLAFYDIKKQYISGIGTHSVGILDTPANACYIRITVDDEHLDTMNLNIHWDGERDGEYEPYVKHEYPVTFMGKSAGNQANSVCDEKLPDGTEITRIGSVDLGSLTWSKDTTSGRQNQFYSSAVSNITTGKSYVPLICSIYAVASRAGAGSVQEGDKLIGTGSSGGLSSNVIVIHDSDCETVADLLQKIANSECYMELATPTTSSGDAYTSEIEGDDYGTMSFDSIVPMGNEFFYPADYALLLDDLGNYTGYDVTKLMLKTDNVIPDLPDGDGEYRLACSVSGGVKTFYWEAV